GEARRGEARRGEARRGEARRGEAIKRYWTVITPGAIPAAVVRIRTPSSLSRSKRRAIALHSRRHPDHRFELHLVHLYEEDSLILTRTESGDSSAYSTYRGRSRATDCGSRPSDNC